VKKATQPNRRHLCDCPARGNLRPGIVRSTPCASVSRNERARHPRQLHPRRVRHDFDGTVKNGGFGKFNHGRGVMPIDKQSSGRDGSGEIEMTVEMLLESRPKD
jgi:hypothetical protein